MYKKNPNIVCPECGAGNKASNWQCWKCKQEGRVTELEEVGGASAPWATNKTVYGGKLREGVGASTFWGRRKRNPLISPEVGLKVAENIFNVNPDSVELEIGEDMHDPIEQEFETMTDSYAEGNGDYAENPRLWGANGKWRRNAQTPVWGGPLYRRRHFYRHNPTGSGARRRNSDQSPVWGDPLFRKNPRSLRRRNAQAPVWGGPLFRNRRNPGSLRRRNAQAPVWGGPLFRRNPGSLRRRNSQAPVWGGPLFRNRNPEALDETCEDCDCAPCKCREVTEVAARRWNPECEDCDCDPCECDEVEEIAEDAARRWNPVMSRTARWAPCAGCGKASCGCGCGGDESLCVCSGDMRHNPIDDLYGVGPEVLEGRRKNSSPVWGGPLFRKKSYRRN